MGKRAELNAAAVLGVRLGLTGLVAFAAGGIGWFFAGPVTGIVAAYFVAMLVVIGLMGTDES